MKWEVAIFVTILVCTIQTQDFTRVDSSAVTLDVASSTSCAWVDINNDDYLDLFVGNWDDNNYLFKNIEGQYFQRITNGIIVNDITNSGTGTFGDYNNDDYVDVFVSGLHVNNQLYLNNGNYVFSSIDSVVMSNEGNLSRGCSWVDYNNDGWLDLFVANSDLNNFLYKNNNNGQFEKIFTGSIVNDGGWSMGANWADYDNDGDQDCFVANYDSETNFLYRNDGYGNFTRIITGEIVTDYGNSFGAAWGDIDNDLDLDLFVSNRHGENNYLYRNDGIDGFTKIYSSPVVTDGGNSCGCAFGDIDNDADLDLFVANWGGEIDFLYLNDGAGTFSRDTTTTVSDTARTSRGAAFGDYDRDGDLDLFVANYGTNTLYRNEYSGNNWLIIKLLPAISNQSAIGSQVTAKAMINNSWTWQLREVFGQSGYYSQNSLDIEFGFGDASLVDSIIVSWPSGYQQVLEDIATNQYLIISEQSNWMIGDLDFNGVLNINDVLYLVDVVLSRIEPPLNGMVSDLNEDNEINILDIVTLINWIFY